MPEKPKKEAERERKWISIKNNMERLDLQDSKKRLIERDWLRLLERRRLEEAEAVRNDFTKIEMDEKNKSDEIDCNQLSSHKMQNDSHLNLKLNEVQSLVTEFSANQIKGKNEEKKLNTENKNSDRQKKEKTSKTKVLSRYNEDRFKKANAEKGVFQQEKKTDQSLKLDQLSRKSNGGFVYFFKEYHSFVTIYKKHSVKVLVFLLLYVLFKQRNGITKPVTDKILTERSKLEKNKLDAEISFKNDTKKGATLETAKMPQINFKSSEPEVPYLSQHLMKKLLKVRDIKIRIFYI